MAKGKKKGKVHVFRVTYIAKVEDDPEEPDNDEAAKREAVKDDLRQLTWGPAGPSKIELVAVEDER